MRSTAFLAATFAVFITAACTTNERTETDDHTIGTAGDVEVSNADKDFVHELGIAGMAEVELGKLAVQRGTHAEVKKFGQMMIDDHTKAGDKLKTVASAHNIAMPMAVDEKHRELHDRLAKLSGAEFDREYVDAMVNGHQDVAGKLESRIDREELTAWRTKMGDWLSGKKMEGQVEVATVTPENSDNVVTMAVNQWAAEGYPVVQAHLMAAKTIDSALEGK